MQNSIEVIDQGDHYDITIKHCVVLGKQDPFFNFRQYVQDLIKDFDQEMTTTLHQIILQDKR